MFNLFDRDFYSNRLDRYRLFDEIKGTTGLEAIAAKIKAFRPLLKCKWRDTFSLAWGEATSAEDYSTTFFLHIRRVIRPTSKKKRKKVVVNPIILKLKKLVKRRFTRFTSL